MQLADRDAHAVGAEVAKTQDTPAGADADRVNLANRPVAQHLCDPAAHIDRYVHALRPPIDVAEGQASLGDRGIVHDRHKAFWIRHDNAKEQRLVAIA